MMRNITVEPQMLESCAARMEESGSAYRTQISELFEAVETMSQVWKGSDNTAFTSRISRFEPDFRQIAALCSEYAEFLRSSARAYRQTQEELASQASSLF